MKNRKLIVIILIFVGFLLAIGFLFTVNVGTVSAGSYDCCNNMGCISCKYDSTWCKGFNECWKSCDGNRARVDCRWRTFVTLSCRSRYSSASWNCGTDQWTSEYKCVYESSWGGWSVFQKVIHRGCSGGDCYSYDEWRGHHRCGLTTYGSWSYYCYNNDRYRKRTVYNRGCSGGSCYYYTSTQTEFVQDCGSDGWTNEYRCSGSWRQRKYIYRGCSGSSCYANPEWRNVENCAGWNYYCKNDDVWRRSGVCSGSSCSWSSGEFYKDCGTDVWEETGNKRWAEINPCKEKEQKEEKYIDYYCSGGTCYSRITTTRWVDTGPTRDVDPDAKKACCEYLGKKWLVGGEVDPGACCDNDSGEYYLTSVSGDACCNSPSKCVVEEACRIPVAKVCSADDAKDSDIRGGGDAIDDYWCTWNIHDGCLVKSGVKLVHGQSNPPFWEGESCGGDGGSSILWGEKKVYVDNITRYLIKARVYIDDNSWVWINGVEVPGLRRGCCGWTSWVDVTTYFNIGWNTIEFKAEDTCSGSGGRYFDMAWDIEVINQPPTATNLGVEYQTYCGIAPETGLIGFKWTYSDPDGDSQTRFDFQVDNNSGFSSPEVARSFTVDKPSPNYNTQIVLIVSSPQSDKITYTPSPYHWRVRVYDNKGDNSGWIKGLSFNVARHAWPWPDFTYLPTSPSTGEKAQFQDLSETFGGTVIASWNWTFQDATPLTSNEQNPEVIFNSQGLKEVTLKVTDTDGYMCPLSRTINVTLPLPRWREVAP